METTDEALQSALRSEVNSRFAAQYGRTPLIPRPTVRTPEFSVQAEESPTWRYRMIDVDDPNMPPSAYKSLFSINYEDFEDLCRYISPSMKNSVNRNVRNALAIFLSFLRTGVSQDNLATLYGMSEQRISYAIDAVSEALDTYFVPRFLGYSHISRAEIIRNHTRSFATILTQSSRDTLILVPDATYLYIQKSANFDVQKETYSMHKYDNLVKVMMLVTTTGYILAVEGLYCADGSNNDAAILNNMVTEPAYGFSSFLQSEVCLVVNRGFRDSVALLESFGHEVKMPSLLPRTQKQLTCKEGNESRLCTAVRWVVESANGRLKNVFPFFGHTISNKYLCSTKLNRFVRIACAILNR